MYREAYKMHAKERTAVWIPLSCKSSRILYRDCVLYCIQEDISLEQ